MDLDLIPVTCPTCFEVFEVAPPAPGELPTEWDYDCEICCRPMVIVFSDDGSGSGAVVGEARGIHD